MNISELSMKLPKLKEILDTVCVVDVGNTYVKTNELVLTPSTVIEVTKLEDVNYTNAFKVEWKGKLYIVGSRKGEPDMSPDKFKSEHYKVNLLSAIVAHFDNKKKIDVRLVLGLPPKHFDEYNVELKKEILALGEQSIKIDGVTYQINILDVLVSKQGSTLSVDRIEEFKYPLMLLDFGGGTLDISYWEKQMSRKARQGMKLFLTETRSFTEFGFEIVMSEMVTRCNSMPGSDGKCNSYKLIEYLEEGEIPLAPEGFIQELKEDILIPFCKNVFAKIKVELSPNSCKDIRIIGGPAKMLMEYLAPMFLAGNPTCIGDINDTQYINAILFADNYKEILTLEYLANNKELAIEAMKEKTIPIKDKVAITKE